MASPDSLETRQFCRSPLEVAQFGFQDPGPATSPRMRPPAKWGRPGLCIPWSEEGADSRQACGSGRELRPLPGSREQAARPPRGPGTPLQLGLRGGLHIVRRPLSAELSQAASSAPITLARPTLTGMGRVPVTPNTNTPPVSGSPRRGFPPARPHPRIHPHPHSALTARGALRPRTPRPLLLQPEAPHIQ